MKDLVRAPLLLSLLLSIPLWIVLGNFIVALIVALLIAFLLAMCHSLCVLHRKSSQLRHLNPVPTETTIDTDIRQRSLPDTPPSPHDDHRSDT